MSSSHPVALVTGCRAGIGRATALALARAGYKVYAGLRDPATAGELVAASEGLPIVPIALDVTVPAERDRVVGDIAQAEGRLDVLVNNAGVALDGPLELVSELELRHVLDVNVVGAWGMTRACLPIMRANESGHVIMISSMSGRMAMPGMGAYAASKFALEGMSEAWRHEVAPFGVQVVLVEPGPYRTDLFARSVAERAVASPGPYERFVARFRELQAGVLRAAGDPEEVAQLVVRLVQDPRPALRHPIGPTTTLRLALKRLLPDGALEALVRLVTSPRRRRRE
ncbi:MAG: SDR family NAD(P)-dependent oxidoreductase [Deltaproteobacteria bacterium]|nr:SDR family NAD(P)-dependent oxidoreductase [Deltaproteobacteria bacterium]